MRALTVQAHYAAGIAFLWKRCENRKRPIPPSLIGERIAIHAGATLPKGWAAELQAAAPRPIVWRECADHGYDVAYADGPWGIVTTRAIVATAVLAECGTPGWYRKRLLVENPPWMAWGNPSSPYWWRLADVRWLTTPVPFPKPLRGQLGLWHLDRVSTTIDAAVQSAPWEAA